MPATKQLRLSFPERQLLLPLTDPVDQPSNIGEDLVDVVDLNADEFIVVHGTNCVTVVHDHDAEIDF